MARPKALSGVLPRCKWLAVYSWPGRLAPLAAPALTEGYPSLVSLRTAGDDDDFLYYLFE